MKLSRSGRAVVVTVHVAGATAWTALLTAAVALQAASPRQVDVVLSDDVVRWWVIMPLVGATVVSGLVLSCGTVYGLIRWRWMVSKLYLVCLLLGGGTAIFIMPTHHDPITRWFILALLILITALSTSKPGGRTRLGRQDHTSHRKTV